MNTALRWLQGFVPAPMPVHKVERLRSFCGAFLGIFLTGIVSTLAVGATPALPLLIAPMGASTVLLFGVPASPLAQPWSIIGGNLVSALIGVTCVKFFGGQPVFAAALAIALSVAAMFALRCVHPPSGAVALTAVLGGPVIHAQGYHFVLSPVGLNSVLLLLVALLFNNATRRRYPHAPHLDHANKHHTADVPPSDRLGFTPEDMDAALKEFDEVLDVSRDDLEQLFLQTKMHAYRRRFGEITCADIMSHDLVTLEFGTTLEDAWAMFRDHHIKALPVIDRARHVIGIVTLFDFLKHADVKEYKGFDGKFRQFINRTLRTHTEKPEVVGQIMTPQVKTAHLSTHIVELVPLLSDLGLHHIPIVDKEQRLMGIVTQSDLIAALYRGRVDDPAARKIA
jgi:CBS domain-containing membrane protein